MKFLDQLTEALSESLDDEITDIERKIAVAGKGGNSGLWRIRNSLLQRAGRDNGYEDGYTGFPFESGIPELDKKADEQGYWGRSEIPTDWIHEYIEEVAKKHPNNIYIQNWYNGWEAYQDKAREEDNYYNV